MASCSTGKTPSQRPFRKSHACRKVAWCLRKAKRELGERRAHRGLLKVEPDLELAGRHLTKAEHNLAGARYFAAGGFSDWSASAFFYCIYHCFLAILRAFGYESRNQECTIAAVEMLAAQGSIQLEKRFIDTLKISQETAPHGTLIGIREYCQYGIEVGFSNAAEMERLTSLCKEMIDCARDILHGSP